MIHFYDNQTLPVSQWRNGGGETREIISFPPGEQTFSWRLSIATIAADGPFSLFPGVDRVITLLSSAGVTLDAPGRYRQLLQPEQPFAFAGEDNIVAQLTGGISRDFNVMTRRASHQARVTVINTRLTPEAATAGAVYVLAGEWLSGDITLKPGQGVWWDCDGSVIEPASPDAALLVAVITARMR